MSRIKYQSTRYLPFSPEHDSKDVNDYGFADIKDFLGKRLIITVKMDGGNTSLYHDRVAARNGDNALDYSYALLKQKHAYNRYGIPKNIIVYGEWLYHKHSIHYTDLESYFQMFNILDTSTMMFYSWEEVLKAGSLLGTDLGQVVPIINRQGNIWYTNSIQYNAINECYLEFDTALQFEKTIGTLFQKVIEAGHEGIVVRNADAFHFNDFETNVAKCVRKGHVQTDEHWAKSKRVKNLLRN